MTLNNHNSSNGSNKATIITKKKTQEKLAGDVKLKKIVNRWDENESKSVITEVGKSGLGYLYATP